MSFMTMTSSPVSTLCTLIVLLEFPENIKSSLGEEKQIDQVSSLESHSHRNMGSGIVARVVVKLRYKTTFPMESSTSQQLTRFCKVTTLKYGLIKSSREPSFFRSRGIGPMILKRAISPDPEPIAAQTILISFFVQSSSAFHVE